MFSPLEEDTIEEEHTNEAAHIISHSKSYSLPEHSLRKRNKMGSNSRMYTNELGSSDKVEKKANEVLTFHGIILRSQLVEMLKNKIFFEEKDDVSFITSYCYT